MRTNRALSMATKGVAKAALIGALMGAMFATQSLSAAIAPADKLVYRQAITKGGGSYTYEKFMGADGKPYSVIRDSRGNVITEDQLPRTVYDPVSRDVREFLIDTAIGGGDPIKVDIAIMEPEIGPVVSTVMEYNSPAGYSKTVSLKGKSASDSDLQVDLDSRVSAIKINAGKIQAGRRMIVDRIVKTTSLARSDISDWDELPGTLTVTLTKAQLQKLVDSGLDRILAIEKFRQGQVGAINVREGVSIVPNATSGPNAGGIGIGIYMTEDNCPAVGAVTNYTKIGPSTPDAHAMEVAQSIRFAAPQSWLYCEAASPPSPPSSGDISGSGSGNPVVQVASTSFGWAHSTDYDTHSRDWDNMIYAYQLLTFALAGNKDGGDGASWGDCQIWGPGKAFNVVTVGNYVNGSSPRTIFAGYSASGATNFGRSCGDESETENYKPEIAAPGSENFIDPLGYNLSPGGTSFATPIAAGFGANMIAKIGSTLSYHASLSRAAMLAVSDMPIAGGTEWVQVGGIDFSNIADSSGSISGTKLVKLQNWTAADTLAGFNSLDAGDVVGSNTYVDTKINLTAGQDARVVLAWLERGDYIRAHRGDSYPLGLDLDLYIMKPDGTWLPVSSANLYNNYEIVNFTVPTTGEYTIKISRHFRRDTSQKVDMSIAVRVK